MCEKVSFKGYESARASAKKLHSNNGEFWRVYACPHCGRWHLTTQRDELSFSILQPSKKPVPRARTLDELEELAKLMRGRRADVQS